MEYTAITLDINGKNTEIFIESTNATRSFNLNEMDVEFIEQDILENNAKNGSFDAIVDEGLINIEWQIVNNNE